MKKFLLSISSICIYVIGIHILAYFWDVKISEMNFWDYSFGLLGLFSCQYINKLLQDKYND